MGARSELRCKVRSGTGLRVDQGEAWDQGRLRREGRQSEGRREPSEHSTEDSGRGIPASSERRGLSAGSLSGSLGLIIEKSVRLSPEQFLWSPGWKLDCHRPGLREETEVGAQRSLSDAGGDVSLGLGGAPGTVCSNEFLECRPGTTTPGAPRLLIKNAGSWAPPKPS